MINYESLIEQFEEMGITATESILDKCIHICTTYNITDAIEFVEQWMAFSVSHLNGAEPTIEYLNDMERKEYMHKKNTYFNKNNQNKKLNIDNQVKLKVYNNYEDNARDVDDDHENIMDSYLCTTPKVNKAVSRVHQNTPEMLFKPQSFSPMSSKTKDTLSSGKVVYTYGSTQLLQNINWAEGCDKKNSTIKVKQIGSNDNFLNINTKYMLDQMLTKFTINQIKMYNDGLNICANILNMENTDDYSFQLQDLLDTLCNNDISNTKSVNCVGTVCLVPLITKTGQNTDNKLNSIYLINFNENINNMTQINLTQTITPYSIFPGQTVYMKGINPLGDKVHVEEIHSTIKLKHANNINELNENLSIVIAIGPFAFQTNLLYEPLHDLISYCKLNKPNVLILVGPFLDSEHNLLSDLAESFKSFFDKIIRGIIESIGSHTKILVISSSKDAFSSFVYPTHPYAYSQMNDNICFLPDPCIIDINGVTIGITATDIVKHISDQEITKNTKFDKIKRVVSHLLNQQSFYPLNPPHEDINLDSKLQHNFCNIDVVPDILILSSEVKYFIREVDNCVAINPGKLGDENNGTYARLIITPPKNESNAFNYVASQILKI